MDIEALIWLCERKDLLRINALDGSNEALSNPLEIIRPLNRA